MIGEESMPWKIEKDNEKCPEGYAVVKDTGKVVGCHKTREDAIKQLRALYASEGK
jgi:hypothetical protein